MNKNYIEQLKSDISQILVKWDMPTRQIAINEIIQKFKDREASLFQAMEEEKKELVSHEDESIVLWKDGYNKAISDCQSLLIKSDEI